LPFDFYIPSLNTCVEFDGPQHFQETPHFCHQIDRDPKDQLEYVQMHDEMKNQYCDNAGINLIRIKYTQIDEVEDILDRKLIRTRNEEAS
jgi:very-short-patch-repair endonuclease